MDEINWGKIVARLIAGFFFLSLCQTISKSTNTNSRLTETRNELATLNAKNPLMLTITSMTKTQRAERRNQRATERVLGTSVVLNSPTHQPTRTPHPTSTPRPTSTSITSTSNTSSDSGESESDNTLFSIATYIDIKSLQSTMLELAKYWFTIMIPIFVILFVLNGIAGQLINSSKHLINRKFERSLARTLLLIYGIFHFPLIIGFYIGIVFWMLGFTTIVLSANRNIELHIIDLIIFILTFSSWLFVIGGIIRGFRAFHLFNGRNHYLLLPAEAPKLYDMLSEIASKLGTLPIQEVRIVPNAQIELVERGSWILLPFVKRKRVLVLGIASLQHMTHSQFTTLISHQYQLIQHQRYDLGAGSFIVRGRDSMRRMIEHMLHIDYDGKFNFIWYSFKFFHDAYLVVTHDIINLHILLVDCAIAQEDDNLDSALTQFEFDTRLFTIHKNAQINASIAHRTPILNLYQTMFNSEEELERAATQLESGIYYRPNYSDRYPPAETRLQAIAKSLTEITIDVPKETTVMSLFVDPDGLMHKMTILIMRQIPSAKYNKNKRKR